MSAQKLSQDDLFAKLESLEKERDGLLAKLNEAERAKDTTAAELALSIAELEAKLVEKDKVLSRTQEELKAARDRVAALEADVKKAQAEAAAALSAKEEAEKSLEQKVAERLKALGVRDTAGGGEPARKEQTENLTEKVLKARGYKTLAEALAA